MSGGRLTLSCACVLGIFLLLAPQARAQEAEGALRWLGQVRKGEVEHETESPNLWDGDLGVVGLPYRTSMETFFRLGRDFSTDDGVSDFYAGFLHTQPTANLDMTLGRQFINTGPGGVFVADAGKVRIDPGWPVDFTLFGGAPRYFEPTYSSEILSQDEIIFGGNVTTTRLAGSRLSLGYLQLERDQKELRQLVTGTASRACKELPGSPNFYGSIGYDADRQNLDVATGGVDIFLGASRVGINLEGTYYQPQDEERNRPQADMNRREDPIFELFSISEMGQGRAGLRYPLTKTVSAFGDYSFQHYELQDEGEVQNAHVASAGLLWLPGGDGLEAVRVEYYVTKTEDDNVNGGKIYYENRLYKRLSFRSKLDVTHYEQVNNKSDTAVTGFLALGYELCRGLVWELNFEANHNESFDEEFRFGFLIRYDFRQRLREKSHEWRRS